MANPSYGSSGQSSRTSAAASEAGESYESMKGDIANLTESVRKLASEQMGSAVEGAQEQVKQKLGAMESTIRKNPTQAALIAAGIGFVVGLVMIR